MMDETFNKNEPKHRAEGNHLMSTLTNLFKRSNGKHVAVTKTLSIQKEGESRLKVAMNKLTELRVTYKNGNFSGHPENMLEDIELQERHVSSLQAAQKRGWKPDEQVILQLEADIASTELLLLEKSYSIEDIQSEVAWRKTHLKEAKLGLR